MTKDPLLDRGVEVVSVVGKNGHQLQVYRIFGTEEGDVTEELISNDYYRPRDQLIRVGTKDFDKDEK